MHYWARKFGVPYSEYHLMTTGQIEDLVICNNISSEYMEETFQNEGIPDVR